MTMQYTIHRFESVTSTNDVVIGMAEDGAPEGTVVIAREQTAGRGRRGRKWQSSAGGLYLSIVLRPGLPIERHQEIAYVASLAACEAVRRVSGLDARIKQPNDILLNGRKVCGILVEARAARGRGGERARGRPVVVGIGVNVNNAEFPPEIAGKATSIALEVGHAVSLKKMEEALLSSLGARYEQLLSEGFESVFQAWTEVQR